jgi:malonyl-CoA/methylmalonyl-CoA synthetase
MDMSSALDRAVARAPGGWICDPTGAVDLATLHARSERAAAVIARRGRPGGRVALLAPSGIGFLVALFGAFRARRPVVVLSTLHPPAETTYFCDHAGVEQVLFDDALAAAALPLARPSRGVGEPRALVPLSALDDAGAFAGAFRGAGSPLGEGPHPDDDALVLYTSGTTSHPKGARLTHRNLAVQAAILRHAWRWSPADRLVHSLPLHHLHGLNIALLTALLAGASVDLHPKFDAHALFEALAPPDRDDAPGLRAALSATRPVLMTVPTILRRLIATFDEGRDDVRARWSRSLATLRLTTSGSAALATPVSGRWRELTGEVPLERFGMTEIGVGTCMRLDRPRVAGSAGWPLDTVEVRAVDEQGRALPPGHDGELLIRGPSVFPGYDLDEEATRAAFVADHPGVGPAGGPWFRSGDLVCFEDDGSMRVKGRLSVDVLKSGGYKISALEVEAVLREAPSIDDVAVVGLPDADWGDRVVAAVVVHPGASFDEAALRALCRERLAAYKVPKQIAAVAELPRNVVGKVVKPRVVELLSARFDGGAAAAPARA